MLPDTVETFIPRATYDALTEDDRDQLRDYATERTWFVRVSTHAEHLDVRLSRDCPLELQRKLGIEAKGE